MTQQQLRLPKGSRHSLPIDSIALAVSDRDGIVRWVNNDFAAVSRFKFADLIGRDHQLIRHPATPAGVYREMTEALRHGQSFSAYLDCLAADRSTYPLLTTVLPMGDNYVSIAVSPLLDHYRSQITQVYKAVRPRELERRYWQDPGK